MKDTRTNEAISLIDAGRKLVRELIDEMPESGDRAFLSHANDLASRTIEFIQSAAK